MSERRVRPIVVVVASFLGLTVGFAAGAWFGGQQASEAPQSPMGATGAPHPVGPAEYQQLGARALAAGNYAAAERSFRAAVAMSPDDPGPRADLALALMAQGRWQEADEEIRRARELDASVPEFDLIEGILARDGLADTARAKAAFARYLERVPPDAPQVAEIRAWLEETGVAPD